jgi:hypothetical protein
MDCYLYNQKNRLIYMTGFRLCYNPYKYIPNQDSMYSYVQPHQTSQPLAPGHIDIYDIITNKIKQVTDQRIFFYCSENLLPYESSS